MARTLAGVLCCWLRPTVALVCAVLASCAGLSCASGKAPRPAGQNAARAGISEINLLAAPVALNFDGHPGLDGFAIKIYASHRSRAKPVKIEEGRIDIYMFDGVPGVTSGPTEPLRTWTYSATEFQEFEIESSIGTAYQFAAAWGEAKPTRSKISVAVRYTPPQGLPVVSKPSIISVALK